MKSGLTVARPAHSKEYQYLLHRSNKNKHKFKCVGLT